MSFQTTNMAGGTLGWPQDLTTTLEGTDHTTTLPHDWPQNWTHVLGSQPKLVADPTWTAGQIGTCWSLCRRLTMCKEVIHLLHIQLWHPLTQPPSSGWHSERTAPYLVDFDHQTFSNVRKFIKGLFLVCIPTHTHTHTHIHTYIHTYIYIYTDQWEDYLFLWSSRTSNIVNSKDIHTTTPTFST